MLSNTPLSLDAIQQREASISGKPPRIAATYSEHAVALAQEQTAKLRGAASGNITPVAREDIPEMLLALMCHPDLYERVAGLSIQLLGQGALRPRDRELVVLRVAWLCQAPYEWGEHVRMAKREGISSVEIENITFGSSHKCWTQYESALIKAAEELHSNAMISDATWAVLAETLDDRQLFELTVLVGQFTLVAYFQNALRFKLSRGNEGLAAR